jgi:hypothetical protein
MTGKEEAKKIERYMNETYTSKEDKAKFLDGVAQGLTASNNLDKQQMIKRSGKK